jgi:hypothetical protein
MALRKKTPGGGGAAKRSPQRAPTVLEPTAIALRVELRNAPEVGRALAQTPRGWDLGVSRGPATPTGVGLSHVRNAKRGYAIRSHDLDEDLSGLGIASVTCAVIADLAQDHYETRHGCLALHFAAFRYRAKLIALTGPRRAGKSTLAARLTAEPDMQLFCDDVPLLLPDGQAVGLGIAPRLRLPLPQTASPDFLHHAGRHMGPRDDRYGYLCAPHHRPAWCPCPPSVMVLLDRHPEGEAALHAMRDDEALR